MSPPRSLRSRFGTYPPAEVVHDEFTEDVEENRLLKGGDLEVGPHARLRSGASRRSLGQLDAVLERVSLVGYDPQGLPDVSYTRLSERYRPAVELAKLVLRSAASFELGHGRVRASSFLVDMNRVFEDFVVVALREALGATEREFPQGAEGRRLFLDEARRVRLEPDLSW